MSSYTPTKKLEVTFEDDTVKVQFKLLTRGQFSKLLPFFSQVQGDTPDPSSIMGMLDAASEFIDECIIKFSGLHDQDGNELEFQVVKDDQYFTNLFVEIIGKILEASSVQEKKQGTLKPVSDSISQDSA